MNYDSLKALHIIFMVTWFAGLFYIVRLFVYHRESADMESPAKEIFHEQYKIMERRLMNAITLPSAILTLIFGTWMLVLNPSLLQQGYIHVKLSFVVLLYVYQVYLVIIQKRFQKSALVLSSMKLRVWNEVPTVILIAVVFLIILKNSINWIYGVVGILGVAILLTIAIKLYKRLRTPK
ncbi:MAG: CopD family protein [Flavobacteriales bacterium]|nr:CopD family protein [Flavobacteriales bacterium]MDG1767122.1 CopD family protein [Flavobacteriales bacterium]